MKHREGFTLIELVVALAVVVVASGIIIIRLTGWSSRQTLNSSTRALGNTLRTWRERARTEETAYVLHLEEHGYQISAGKEVLRQGHLAAGESIEGAPTAVTLTPRGILPETRITLRTATGERMTLIVGTLVNEIRYQEEPR